MQDSFPYGCFILYDYCCSLSTYSHGKYLAQLLISFLQPTMMSSFLLVSTQEEKKIFCQLFFYTIVHALWFLELDLLTFSQCDGRIRIFAGSGSTDMINCGHLEAVDSVRLQMFDGVAFHR